MTKRRLVTELLEDRAMLAAGALDVDQDGALTMFDALLVTKALRGEIRVSDSTVVSDKDETLDTTSQDESAPRLYAAEKVRLDVDGDGTVHESDVAAIIEQVLFCDPNTLLDINNDGVMTPRDVDLLASSIREVEDATAEEMETVSAGEGVGVISDGDPNSEEPLPLEDSKDLGNGGGQEAGSQSGSGSASTVNITIYHGQTGSAVSEADEYWKGAFTVANLNDTDGDSTSHNGQMSPPDIADNWVEATPKGRNEVDLMKIVVSKPTPFFGGNTNLSVSGNGAICTHSKKGFCANYVVIKDFEWGNDLHKTFWVEANSASLTMRSISVTVDYNSAAADTVRATGVWAQLSQVEHSSQDVTTVINSFDDLDTNVINMINAIEVKGTGLRPQHANGQAHLAIVTEFQVFPSGIQNEPLVHFDVTRRRESFVSQGAIGDGLLPPAERVPDDPFENQVERPNDDGSTSDEADEPNSYGKISSADIPGLNIGSQLSLGNDALSFQANFQEFVRIGIGAGASNDPIGNTVKGSQGSLKYAWHVRQFFTTATGSWARDPSPPTPTTETDAHRIGPGYLGFIYSPEYIP